MTFYNRESQLGGLDVSETRLIQNGDVKNFNGGNHSSDAPQLWRQFWD